MKLLKLRNSEHDDVYKDCLNSHQ